MFVAGWQAFLPEGRNPAVSDGHLIAGGSTSVDTTNGAELWRKQHAPVNSAVMAKGSAWSMQFVSSELRYNLVRRDAWFGTEQWVTNLGPQTYVSEATLTRKDATLLQDRAVVLAVDNGAWKLLAFELPGRQLATQGWVTERGSNARNAAAR